MAPDEGGDVDEEDLPLRRRDLQRTADGLPDRVLRLHFFNRIKNPREKISRGKKSRARRAKR